MSVIRPHRIEYHEGHPLVVNYQTETGSRLTTDIDPSDNAAFREALDRFLDAVSIIGESVLLALADAVIPSTATLPPSVVHVCRICDIRSDDPKTDPMTWHVTDKGIAYCGEHRRA